MDIERIIDTELWDAISSNYNVGKYTNSIIDAMLFLSNMLRDKANLEDDGVKLINNIFTKQNPKIKVTRLETETDRNIQDGIAYILRGLYQSIRNPRHHEKIEDDEVTAKEIILFIDYLLRIIEKSKAKFEIDDIVSLVFDEEFVNDNNYVKLILSRIPKRKLFDVLINIYRNKTNGNIENLPTFFASIFEELTDNEKSDFITIISDDLLKTNDDKERKYILKCFPAKYWEKVDDISKRRTENRIIKSIREGHFFENKKTSGGWFATWCTHLIKYFVLKDKMIFLITDIIQSNEISRIKYIFKFIMNYVWDILDEDVVVQSIKNDIISFTNYGFIVLIKEEIDKGNILFFNYINDNKYQIPKYILEFYQDSLKKFKNNPNIKTFSENDSPDFPDDEIPF
jgi:uncharacterized protein (TIGR02391 family)